MTRNPVDFNAAIEPRYREIHGRLENWARSLRSPTGQATASGFGLSVSSDARAIDAVGSISVDTHDAGRIDKAVRALPDDHRIALQWFYVAPGSTRRARTLIGCTLQQLDELVKGGRCMLVNRRA